MQQTLFDTEKLEKQPQPCGQVEPIVSRTCQRCGYVHSSDNARVVNRFSAGEKIFIAKHGNIQRRTRTEAEHDECNWRINKNAQTENETETM